MGIESVIRLGISGASALSSAGAASANAAAEQSRANRIEAESHQERVNAAYHAAKQAEETKQAALTMAAFEGLLSTAAATRNSNALKAAAEEEKQNALYNTNLLRYSSEVDAQKAQYDADSQTQTLDRTRQMAKYKLADMQYQTQMAGEDAQRTAFMASQEQASGQIASSASKTGAASSPMAMIAANQTETLGVYAAQSAQRNMQHALMVQKQVADYEDSMNLYQQHQLRQNASTAQFNARQKGLFQGAAINQAAYAKAASYQTQASDTLTSNAAQLFGVGLGQSTGVSQDYTVPARSTGAAANYSASPLFSAAGQYSNQIAHGIAGMFSSGDTASSNVAKGYSFSNDYGSTSLFNTGNTGGAGTSTSLFGG